MQEKSPGLNNRQQQPLGTGSNVNGTLQSIQFERKEAVDKKTSQSLAPLNQKQKGEQISNKLN